MFFIYLYMKILYFSIAFLLFNLFLLIARHDCYIYSAIIVYLESEIFFIKLLFCFIVFISFFFIEKCDVS